MAADRTVYHVVPNARAEAWVVTQENDNTFREEYRTKEEAVAAAKTRARDREPSQVKVHSDDGDMDYESTYQNDPRRFPS